MFLIVLIIQGLINGLIMKIWICIHFYTIIFNKDSTDFSQYSYNLSLQSPLKVNPGVIIKGSTMSITPPKDMSKADF